MATGVVTQAPTTRSVTIDTDLSSKKYHFVDMDTTDDNVVNLVEDQATVPFVLLDDGDGSSTSKTGSIAIDGVTKITLGGTVSAGAPVAASTGGVGIAAADGDYFGAIALENGVSGDVIPVRVTQGYLETT